MHTIRRILVPVDYSPISNEALEFALSIAAPFGAAIELLHVLEVPFYFPPETIVRLSEVGEQPLETFARAQAEREMDKLLAAVEASGERGAVQITKRLELGVAWETIVAIASAGHHDLIVIGTHGRRGFDRVLMGSVAEKVVRRAPCAVLTVKKRGEESAR